MNRKTGATALRLPRHLTVLLLTLCLSTGSQVAYGGESGEPLEPPATERHFGHIAGWSTIGLGLGAVGVGAGLHLAHGELTTTSQILYIGGGFVTLVGVFILATSYAGHPSGEPPAQAVLPYVGPESAGLMWQGSF